MISYNSKQIILLHHKIEKKKNLESNKPTISMSQIQKIPKHTVLYKTLVVKYTNLWYDILQFKTNITKYFYFNVTWLFLCIIRFFGFFFFSKFINYMTVENVFWKKIQLFSEYFLQNSQNIIFDTQFKYLKL